MRSNVGYQHAPILLQSQASSECRSNRLRARLNLDSVHVSVPFQLLGYELDNSGGVGQTPSLPTPPLCDNKTTQTPNVTIQIPDRGPPASRIYLSAWLYLHHG